MLIQSNSPHRSLLTFHIRQHRPIATWFGYLKSRLCHQESMGIISMSQRTLYAPKKDATFQCACTSVLELSLLWGISPSTWTLCSPPVSYNSTPSSWQEKPKVKEVLRPDERVCPSRILVGGACARHHGLQNVPAPPLIFEPIIEAACRMSFEVLRCISLPFGAIARGDG